MSDRAHINGLPTTIIEKIMTYLSFRHIEAVSSVGRKWSAIGSIFIKNGFFNLSYHVDEELRRLKLELTTLPQTVIFLRERITFLRSFFFFEMLLCELSLIKAFWKNVLYNDEGDACSLGLVLDQLYHIYGACKGRNIPFLRIHNALEKHIVRSTTKFFAHNIDNVILNRTFGCQIIDLINLLVERSYAAEVKYKCKKDMISSTGYYQLPHLNAPSESRDVHESPLAQRRALLMLILTWVRECNRATLREEHTSKEWELHELLEGADLGDISELLIMSEVREYPLTLREVDHGFERGNVLLSFKSETLQHRRHFQGVELRYQIYCPLNRAPWLIYNAWSRTKEKIKNNTFLEDEQEGQKLRRFINSLDARVGLSEDIHDRDCRHVLTLQSTTRLVNGYKEISFMTC